MTARHYYREVGGSLVEQTSRILREGWQTRENAEEGSVGSTTVVVNDLGMDQDYTGHRRWLVIEDESESDDDVLYAGYTGTQEISRGEDEETLEPLGRVWAIELYDVNTLWSRRVMTGTDCNRPAESDVERMQWLLATNEASPWFENITDYVATGSPVDMDKVDYRGQMFDAIADDCAQQSKKNWFVRYIKNAVSGDRELCAFYGAYIYDSPLFLSNDDADFDDDAIEDGSSFVWPISPEAKLKRNPDRVYTGGYLQYEKGAIYRTRPATETAFDLGGRDMIVPAPNVKTKAKAIARVNRALLDASKQDERITTTIYSVPKRKATMLKSGMRVPYKATHQPGYQSWRFVRILNASPHPIAAGSRYDIALELQGPGTGIACPLDPGLAGTPSDFYGPLGGTTTDSRGNVWYSAANANFFSPDHQPSAGPYPAHTCHGLGFADYSTVGGDAGGTSVQSVIRFVFVGSGTADVSMLAYGATDATWTWRQWYYSSGGEIAEQSDISGGLRAGSTASVVVGALPSDAVSCYRYIEIGIGDPYPGGSPGTKLVFPGITWTLDA